MSVIEIFLIAIALGMDAFSVAICKGLSLSKLSLKNTFRVAGFFGGFQAIMPAIGYFLGKNFEEVILQIDHWVAFILLSGIGINLIRDVGNDEQEKGNDKFDWKTLTLLAIATSIDALAIGITFSFLEIQITFAIFTIGIVAFILSAIGVVIGSKVGDEFNKKAKILGGIILIGMATKILIEHLFLK